MTTRNPQPAIRKILLIRFSSIGDIVLTSPVIRCLHRQLGAEVHFLTKKNYQSWVGQNPYLKKAFGLEENWSALVHQLRAEQYDLIVDLHHNLRTFRLKKQLWGVPSVAFEKLNFEKWLLVNFKKNKLPDCHIVDRYLATVEHLGVRNDGEGLDFFIDDTMPFEYVLPLQYIALPVGAGHVTKALTTEQIIAICQQAPLPVVLLGGMAEVAKSRQIIKKIQGQEVLNLVGKLSLNASAQVVKKAEVVISGDTGLMHIAAALKRPLVTIWGNTVPDFGMTPYYPKRDNRSIILEKKELSCRPCSKIGYPECPKGHFECIKTIEVADILAAVQKLIA